MPVCTGCGGSYDDKFKFCPNCGRAKPETSTLNINVTSDDIWETCEIYLVENRKSILFSGDYFFEATAIGTKGRYSAGLSEILKKTNPFSPIINGDYYFDSSQFVVLLPKRCQPKLDELISKLVANGWQSTGRGQEWYSERFKRKVKK